MTSLTSLYLIKGSRFDDPHPILTTDVVKRNMREGVETCLMLDLNVLVYMEDVVCGRKTLETTGLHKAVSILNSTHGLILVPGFGLHETSTPYLAARFAAFETFLRTYCPAYGDAWNSTLGSLQDRIKKGVPTDSFANLEEGKNSRLPHCMQSCSRCAYFRLKPLVRPLTDFLTSFDSSARNWIF